MIKSVTVFDWSFACLCLKFSWFRVYIIPLSKTSNTALDRVERNKGFPANSLFTVATFSINTALVHGGYASESLDTKSDIVIQLSVL